MKLQHMLEASQSSEYGQQQYLPHGNEQQMPYWYQQQNTISAEGVFAA